MVWLYKGFHRWFGCCLARGSSSHFSNQNSYPKSSSLPFCASWCSYIHTPTKWQVLSVPRDLDSRVMYTRGRGTSKDQIIVLRLTQGRLDGIRSRRDTKLPPEPSSYLSLSLSVPLFLWPFLSSFRHSRPAFLSRWQVFVLEKRAFSFLLLVSSSVSWKRNLSEKIFISREVETAERLCSFRVRNTNTFGTLWNVIYEDFSSRRRLPPMNSFHERSVSNGVNAKNQLALLLVARWCTFHRANLP